MNDGCRHCGALYDHNYDCPMGEIAALTARAERAEAAIENEAIVTRELTARAEQAEREVKRLRAFIQSLDGKTIAIRGEGNTFIDDGIVVASDILGAEQRDAK